MFKSRPRTVSSQTAAAPITCAGTVFKAYISPLGFALPLSSLKIEENSKVFFDNKRYDEITKRVRKKQIISILNSIN